jgi:DNA-binding CsgD family transcriptional regulator
MLNTKNRLITYQALPSLIKLAAPLQKLGIARFNHDMTFGKGKIAILTNSIEVFSIYYHQQLPMLCTNDDGRTLAPGFYLSKALIEEDQRCAQIIPTLHHQFNFSHSLYIIERELDCQHMYTFTSKLPEAKFLHCILNHFDNFKDYLLHYKRSASKIISEAKQPKHWITLANSNAMDLYNRKTIDSVSNELNANCVQDNLILLNRKTQLPYTLSSKQSLCIKLLAQGLAIKEIARQMGLSPRTVEHHLERIKFALDCRTIKELFMRYAIHLVND